MEEKMKDYITWYERYKIALKEDLSIRDIMLLRNVGQPTAINLRREALEYCMKNDITVINNKPPTEVLMLLTGKDLDYYHEKMVLELEAINLHQTVIEDRA